MDLSKLKIPALVAVSALLGAVGTGQAVGSSREKVERHDKQIEKLEEKTEQDRLDVMELKTTLKTVAEDIKHIKRKLDGDRR